MKKAVFHKLSLRMRISLFTGLVILVTSILLTVLSMYNATDKINMVFAELHPAVEFPTNSVSSDNSINSSDTGTAVLQKMEAATASTPSRKASRLFNLWSVGYMFVVSLGGILVVYWAAGKALKPLSDLKQTILHINEKHLDERIPQNSVKDEIGSLTDSFNAMLDRLDEGFQQQKCFSANASHELKTPIATISTSLQVLEMDEEPSCKDYMETFDIIKRTTARLANLIDDLMALSDDEYDFPLEYVSLNSMLIGIVNDLQPQYHEKKLQVHTAFEKNETFILCSESLAHRVFHNLIENSMKYNKENGEIMLRICEDNENIRVCISDTGIGIAEENISKVWDAFYCVEKSRSRKLGGSGLGLSIVKHLTDRLRWEISMESTLNQGTTFTIEAKKTLRGRIKRTHTSPMKMAKPQGSDRAPVDFDTPSPDYAKAETHC